MPAAATKIDPAWQEHFDFLLPRRELLRADEVAKALGVDEKTVHRLFETYLPGSALPALPGHEINAATGQRQHRRYRRAGVILHLAAKANYAPADLRARLFEIAAQLPTPDLVLMQQALAQLLRTR